MTGAAILTSAYILDLIIGDPQWAPHPVRYIGAAINKIENILRKMVAGPVQERRGGVLLTLLIVLSTYLITSGLVLLITRFSGQVAALVGSALLVWLAATTIATKELIRSSQVVLASIDRGELESARTQVSMIVGRDTKDLSEKGILKATIETLAENLSDGIVAPLFYFAIGGLPLAMTYKAINTLDSMVGYKNERYQNIGWASAKLDDVANYVPARISGLFIVVSVFLLKIVKNASSALHAAKQSFLIMQRDGRKHTSPNSGVPEAAMAGALGVQLGGPSAYGGILVHKPYIGDANTDDYRSASRTAITIVAVTSVLAMAFAALFLSWRALA